MMQTAATLSYFLPPGMALSVGVHRPQLELTLVSSRDVDTATGVYGDFAIHFAKLRALPIDRSLWLDGVEAPRELTVVWALLALQETQAQNVLPTRVVASAEGGIAICFVEGNKYSDIECLNSGVILGVLSNQHDCPIVWEIEQSA